MVSTTHSQENPGIMGETVGESINPVSRQPDSKKTAYDLRISHDTLDLIQTTPWDFGINMDEPEDVAVCGMCPGIHLYRPITAAHDKLITKGAGKISSAIIASAISDNNLCARCSLSQTRKTLPQQWRLVKDWNNDRERHSNA
jgi:hypothetical protein